jgi:hypothetical protein
MRNAANVSQTLSGPMEKPDEETAANACGILALLSPPSNSARASLLRARDKGDESREETKGQSYILQIHESACILSMVITARCSAIEMFVAVVHAQISRVMLLLADLLIKAAIPLSSVLPLIGDFLPSNLEFFELRRSFKVLSPAGWQAKRMA